MAEAAGQPSPMMVVRRMRFGYPGRLKAWWNPSRREFSQMVNAASLAMPFLEPYLIETMRLAKARIADPKLSAEIDLYIGQESTHYRQHQVFNRRLAELGYAAVPQMEALLKADYAGFAAGKSFAFNLAYAEGFESMALAMGHFLVADRVALFGDGDDAVGSLILWHFVEEIEHKRVTYDAFHALDGRYWMRIWGYLRATAHIMSRTRQGYRALLIEDGLWRSWRSRIALAAMLGRIFLRLAPRMLRVLRPGYDPREIKDPGWARAWQRLHNERPDMSGVLDMRRLAEPIPHLLELS